LVKKKTHSIFAAPITGKTFSEFLENGAMTRVRYVNIKDYFTRFSDEKSFFTRMQKKEVNFYKIICLIRNKVFIFASAFKKSKFFNEEKMIAGCGYFTYLCSPKIILNKKFFEGIEKVK